MLSIPLQTFLISIIMAIACCLPRTFREVQRYSRILLLVGTGGLASLLIWDLIPDAWQIGGARSLAIIALAWGVYTFAHLKHHSSEIRRPHDCQHEHSGGSTRFLMVSMMLHCLTSGILLALAQE